MIADVSYGIVLSLLRTAHRFGEGLVPFFFQKRLVVIDFTYGRLKGEGVDWENYVLRIGLRFIKSSQKPILVKGVRAYLDGEALEDM
jgi:hypothetical protein